MLSKKFYFLHGYMKVGLFLISTSYSGFYMPVLPKQSNFQWIINKNLNVFQFIIWSISDYFAPPPPNENKSTSIEC